MNIQDTIAIVLRMPCSPAGSSPSYPPVHDSDNLSGAAWRDDVVSRFASLNDLEAAVGSTGPGDGAEHEQARDWQDSRDYERGLRSLPVDRVVEDVLFSLLNAARVKLGRRAPGC